MIDPRIEKLAKLCVQYSVAVKPKDKVLIEGSDLAYSLRAFFAMNFIIMLDILDQTPNS